MSKNNYEKTDMIVNARRVSETRDFPEKLVSSCFRGPVAHITKKTRLELLKGPYSADIVQQIIDSSELWELDLTDPHLSLKEFLEYAEVAQESTPELSPELAREIYYWIQNLKSSREHVDVRKNWLQYASDVRKGSADSLIKELVSDGPTKEWALKLFHRMVTLSSFLLDEKQRYMSQLFFQYSETLNRKRERTHDKHDDDLSRLEKAWVEKKYTDAAVLKKTLEEHLKKSSSKEMSSFFDDDFEVLCTVLSRLHQLLQSHALTDAGKKRVRYEAEPAKARSLEVLWDLMESMYLPADVLRHVVNNFPDLKVERKTLNDYNDKEDVTFVTSALVSLGVHKLPDAKNIRRIHQNGEPTISGYLQVVPKGKKKGFSLTLPVGMIQQYIAAQRKMRLQRAEDKYEKDHDDKASYYSLVRDTEQRIDTLQDLIQKGKTESARKNIEKRLKRAKAMLKVLKGIDLEKSGPGVVAEYTRDALSSRLLAFYLADVLLRKHPELFNKHEILDVDGLIELTDRVAIITETRRAGYYSSDKINVRENFGDMPSERMNQLFQSNGVILPELLLVFSPFISFGHYDLAEIIHMAESPTPKTPRDNTRKPNMSKKRKKQPSEKKSIEHMEDEDVLLRRAVLPLSLSRQIQMYTKVRDAALAGGKSPQLPVRKVCSLRAITDREVPNFVQDHRNFFISKGFIESYDEMPSWVSYAPGQIPKNEQFDLVEMVISQETNGVLDERLNNALGAVEPGGVLELTSLTYPLKEDFIKSLREQGCEVKEVKMPGTSYAKMFDLNHLIRSKGYPQEFQNKLKPYIRDATKSIHVLRIRVGAGTPEIDTRIGVVDELITPHISESERALAEILPMVLKQVEHLPQRLAKEFVGAIKFIEWALQYSRVFADDTQKNVLKDTAFWNDPDTLKNTELSLKILGREGAGNSEVIGLLEKFLMRVSKQHTHPAYRFMLLALQKRLRVRDNFEYLPEFVMNLDVEKRKEVLAWLQSSEFSPLFKVVQDYLITYEGERELEALETLETLDVMASESPLIHESSPSVSRIKEISPLQLWKEEILMLPKYSDEQKIRWMTDAFRLGNQEGIQEMMFGQFATLVFDEPALVVSGVINPYSQKIERQFLPQVFGFLTGSTLLRHARDPLLLRFFTHSELFEKIQLSECSASQKCLWFDFSVGKTFSFHEEDEKSDSFFSPNESTQTEALLAMMIYDDLNSNLVVEILNDPDFTFFSQTSVQEAFDVLGGEQGSFNKLTEIAFGKIEHALEFGKPFALQCREVLKKNLSPRTLTFLFQSLGAVYFQKRIEKLTMAYFEEFSDDLSFKSSSPYATLEDLFSGSGDINKRLVSVSTYLGKDAVDVYDELPLFGAVICMASNIPQKIESLFEVSLTKEKYVSFLQKLLDVVFGPEDVSRQLPIDKSKKREKIRKQKAEIPARIEKMITLDEVSHLSDEDTDEYGQQKYIEVCSPDAKIIYGRGIPSQVKKIPGNLQQYDKIKNDLERQWGKYTVLAQSEYTGHDWIDFDTSNISHSLLHKVTKTEKALSLDQSQKLLAQLEKILGNEGYGMNVNKEKLPLVFDASRGVLFLSLNYGLGQAGSSDEVQHQEWLTRIDRLGALEFDHFARLPLYNALSSVFPFEVRYGEESFQTKKRFDAFKAKEKSSLFKELEKHSPLDDLRERVESLGLSMRVDRKYSNRWSHMVYRDGDQFIIEADKSIPLFSQLENKLIFESSDVKKIKAFLDGCQDDFQKFLENPQIELFGDEYEVALYNRSLPLRWTTTLHVDKLYEARVKNLDLEKVTQLPIHFYGVGPNGEKRTLPSSFKKIVESEWVTNMYIPSNEDQQTSHTKTEKSDNTGLFGRFRRLFGG
ncbi:MAG: hypothetical protein P1V18_04700 [Candidatus Gracilibacteria bacterium]|nr:hypothetical protein [Candidatus Gracilibacteria bacterium]